MRKAGSVWMTNTAEAATSEPVRSMTSPSMATVANQSPMKETIWARNTARKSPLRRRRESTVRPRRSVGGDGGQDVHLRRPPGRPDGGRDAQAGGGQHHR